jgi:hypothetical protein
LTCGEVSIGIKGLWPVTSSTEALSFTLINSCDLKTLQLIAGMKNRIAIGNNMVAK